MEPDNKQPIRRFCLICGHGLVRKRIEDRDRDICPDCRWIYYENPLPCAAAFVRGPEGILMVKRGVEPGKGLWGLPSGFMEIDEIPEQTCLRELREETGLEGRIIRLMGVYAQKSSVYKKVVIMGYEVHAEGEPRPGSDTTEVKYFSPDRLPRIAFSSHRKMVEEGLKRAEK